jgi:hypothetical protein
MKHQHGVHEHENKVDQHYELFGENVVTIIIIAAALFIPFAFILHFFPG